MSHTVWCVSSRNKDITNAICTTHMNSQNTWITTEYFLNEFLRVFKFQWISFHKSIVLNYLWSSSVCSIQKRKRIKLSF